MLVLAKAFLVCKEIISLYVVDVYLGPLLPVVTVVGTRRSHVGGGALGVV